MDNLVDLSDDDEGDSDELPVNAGGHDGVVNVGLSDGDEDNAEDLPEHNAGGPGLNQEDEEAPVELCAFNTEDPHIPDLSDVEETDAVAPPSLIDQVVVIVPFQSPPFAPYPLSAKLPFVRPQTVPAAPSNDAVPVPSGPKQNADLVAVQDAAVTVPSGPKQNADLVASQDAAVTVPSGPKQNADLVASQDASVFINTLYKVLMDSMENPVLAGVIGWVDEYFFELKNIRALVTDHFPWIHVSEFRTECFHFGFVPHSDNSNIMRHGTNNFCIGKSELLPEIYRQQGAFRKGEGTSAQAGTSS